MCIINPEKFIIRIPFFCKKWFTFNFSRNMTILAFPMRRYTRIAERYSKRSMNILKSYKTNKQDCISCGNLSEAELTTLDKSNLDGTRKNEFSVVSLTRAYTAFHFQAAVHDTK